MTDTIKITLDDAETQAAFAELNRRSTDMTELMRRITGHMADAAEDSFARQRSPDNVPWVDLSRFTKAARAKRGYAPGQKLQVRDLWEWQKLQVTGTLAASVTAQTARTWGRDFAQIGSNVPYARIHQLGGKAGRNHKVTIPARPFLGLSSEAKQAIKADTIAWLDLNRFTAG